MSSSGKGGSAQSAKNYYGSGGVAYGWGPIDWLNAVIWNGKYVYQGSLTITSDVTDLTGMLVDPTLIASGGFLKLYRGTETQSAPGALPNHPPMKGTVFLEGKHLFFGQNSGTAPNLQLIGGRLPRVTTAIVAAIDNVAVNGQINPIASWAEVLLDERGGDLPVAELDAASWLASAHWAFLNSSYTFISPVITQQSPLRAIAQRLIDPFNGFCRRTAAGKLACVVYEWGVDPGGLPTLDARHWLKKPRLICGDWDSVPTEVLVKFTDSAFEYQANTVLVSNSHAQQVRQVVDQETLDRKDISTKSQAHKHGVEFNRRVGTAPSKEIVKCRAPFMDALLAGDKIKIDTDPEPGGGGLAQIVRIESIEQDQTDLATLTVMTDNLLPAVPYTPAWITPTVTPEVSPPMVNFLAVPLPPLAFGGLPASVGILATRPSRAIVGMEVFFSDLSSNPFDELGTQITFAARATLAAGISAGATTIQLTETDGLAGPEADLAANTPGGNDTAAENNTLLALIVSLDGSGRIALDGSGDPIMEFVSIVDRTPVSGATFSYDVLRGRMDTAAAAWTSGAIVWIFPRTNLTAWRHELFESLAGSVAYFRLVSYTSTVVDESITVPECSVNMLPVTAPMYVRALASVNLYFSFIFKRSATAPATPTGSTPAGWTDGPPAGTDPLYMSRGVKRLDTGALTGTWSAPVRIDGPAGSDALNSALVYIYQRAASTPALPSASTTYTFATAGLTGLNNGWSRTIPSGTDPLYVSVATAAAIGTTDTIGAGEWATAQVLAQNGIDAAKTAMVFIFQRAASAPSLPSATATYTFATAALTGLNNGWSQAIPAGSSPLYVSTASALSTGTTDSITAGEWASAQILALDGAPGSSIEVEWSIDGSTSWHYPFVTGDKYMRERLGSSGTWSAAIKVVGEDGGPGPTGPNGVTLIGKASGSASVNLSLSDPRATGIGLFSITTPADVTVTITGTVTNNTGFSAGTSVILYIDGVSAGGFNAGTLGGSGGNADVLIVKTPNVGAGTHTFEVWVAGYPGNHVDFAGSIQVT